RESNYYSIRVHDEGNLKVLSLDHLIHSYVIPDNPIFLKYDYLKIFAEVISYLSQGNSAPRVLHLGGGGYSLPRYLDAVYPQSLNEVVEIDPAVTQVAHEELGLPRDTRIKTYNQDARLFLIQRPSGEKYQIAVGDVFNDFSTPYHLTTQEFARLVKSHLAEGGVYLVNIIDSHSQGRYMPSFLYTLRQVFRYVYLFSPVTSWENAGRGTFVIAATDRPLDLENFKQFINKGKDPTSNPHDEAGLQKYLAERRPLLLTDDYAPTDILVAPLLR
ncbi:MAG: fused MFS/spermidine synthase, partial [Chloroflexota bacterium]